MRRYPRYNSLGPIQIPILQSYIAMEDRADGTVWYLTHRSSDDRIGISDSVPSRFLEADAHLFGPYDGPYLVGPDRTPIRLFVRSGHIGYDTPYLGNNVFQKDAPIISREQYQRYGLEIIVPTGWAPNDTLAWELVRGTSNEADV